jgi:SAM-dependent methyltransferase
MADAPACRICGHTTSPAGSKRGVLTTTTFLLRRCGQCGFAFVSNPREDYATIYDELYYSGQGADPLVDYAFELEHPESTIRQSEWRGILEVVRSLRPLDDQTRWLDYGCGNGGLVRHLIQAGACRAVGYETGWIAERARNRGIPILADADLPSQEGLCDVVTAIEVIEHAVDPLMLLRKMRRLLKPGGLLFLTTGNAAAHRDLERWDYVRPEIHVSFFEPRTLELALRRAGFRPERRGLINGFDSIIRFKVLKQLRIRRQRSVFDLLPWRTLARIIDAKLSVSAHPIGWAA